MRTTMPDELNQMLKLYAKGEWVKYGIGALTCIGAGIFIAFGPAGLEEETPYHLEIAICFFVWGLLLLLALFVVRIRSLLVSFITGLFAILSGWLAYDIGPSSVQFYISAIFAPILAYVSIRHFWAVFSGADLSK